MNRYDVFYKDLYVDNFKAANKTIAEKILKTRLKNLKIKLSPLYSTQEILNMSSDFNNDEDDK